MAKSASGYRTNGPRSPLDPVFCKWLYIRRADGSMYLKRLRLFECKYFGIYIHWIYSADDDHVTHDHPFDFISFVLRGSYSEFSGMPGALKLRRIRFFNVRKAETPHRIIEASRVPTITLVLRGKRRREWGFYTDDGWIDWRTFLGVKEEPEQ